ncbi:MAG: type II secretion system F family protein [Alphaproteobacteria bacterium]|nr:type II secretion system F family protein [Alphaproteobacteria bacterium]MBN2779569.1 type II secretion system F family protein [Alphaproteobacteria bacterium]
MRNDNRNFGATEKWFAKLLVKHSGRHRLKIYRKLSALLRNNFTLMDALDRLWMVASKDGKKTNEPFAIAISVWQGRLENGETFAHALRGWVPMRERLMLSVGDVSRLETALIHVIHVAEGSERIIAPLIGAIAYPLFLLFLTFLILIMVAVYLVPPLVEAAGRDIVWSGVAGTLVSVSDAIAVYWWMFPLGLIGAISLMALSLPFWTGRLRVAFDKFPPWNLYRLFTGVSWLLSLAALTKSGTPITQGMASLRDDATWYLRERIDKTLDYMSEGENLGAALKHTGFGFPDQETIGDLEIYAELDNFEDALEKIGNDYLDEAILRIQGTAGILNSFAILLISVMIAWVVFGTFEMQEQLTAQM